MKKNTDLGIGFPYKSPTINVVKSSNQLAIAQPQANTSEHMVLQYETGLKVSLFQRNLKYPMVHILFDLTQETPSFGALNLFVPQSLSQGVCVLSYN